MKRLRSACRLLGLWWFMDHKFLSTVVYLNPLTTDDECTHHETLAACYQLAHAIHFEDRFSAN